MPTIKHSGTVHITVCSGTRNVVLSAYLNTSSFSLDIQCADQNPLAYKE